MHSSRLLIMLLLLCAAFLWAAFRLFHHADRFHRALSAVQLDPYGLRVYPDNDALPGEFSLVFFGDSRAEAWPVPALPPSWLSANRGIGGQTTAQILGRVRAQVLPLRPHTVLLQAGVNDLKMIPLFPDRRAQIVEDCKSNLARIVAELRAGGCRVLLTTIFPHGPVPLERRAFWSADVAAAISEVNHFLRGLAGEGVEIFDAAALLSLEDGRLDPAYSLDLLHLNRRGYEHLNRALPALLMP